MEKESNTEPNYITLSESVVGATSLYYINRWIKTDRLGNVPFPPSKTSNNPFSKSHIMKC